MPPRSQAQRRLMWGVATGSIKGSGVPKKVAKEFAAADKPGKLQARIKPKHKTLMEGGGKS